MTAGIELDGAATGRMVDRLQALRAASKDPDAAARSIARILGAHRRSAVSEFAFWVPDLDDRTPVILQILLPPDDLDLTAESGEARFGVVEVPMTVIGDVAVAAVAGVPAGTRTHLGAFYRAMWIVHGERRPLIDPLAYSMPFGPFAPSELVDWSELEARRTDVGAQSALASTPGEDGIPRIDPPTNILQVHVGTATTDGTLASLTEHFRRLGARIAAGLEPTAGEQVWLGYDAVELMPVEPTVVYEDGPPFWEEQPGPPGALDVVLRRPDTTDWGYDVVIAGGAAVNPSLLRSGRPHELADLAAALHEFPGGPIQLVVDVVYGHADDQGLAVLAPAWTTGPDMYGQHLDYRNPLVRAQLLEMQRRKLAYGVDAVRVDGAQDFTWWDAKAGRLVYDDRYMTEISGVVSEVGEHRYRPFMIFEDGRPWPRADWELASSYRAVIERQDHVVQWGPLTFAHNTPFLFTFWVTRWWRLQEIAEFGSTWISGCANHDTLRRGMQVDPDGFINSYLGDSPPEIIRNAYDHPAANLLFHGFLPGIPMDFANASMRGAWSFIRNIDARYAVKVWAEEARFLDWHVTEEWFSVPEAFRRLKGMGFTDFGELRRFMRHLAGAVELHGDDDRPVPGALAAARPQLTQIPLDVTTLRRAARAWMDDVHDYCSLPRWSPDPERARFNLALREFRRSRPWLRSDLTAADRFDYRHPTAGSVVFFGHRSAPRRDDRVALVANMEGAPTVVVPAELLDDLAADEWEPAAAAPGVIFNSFAAPLTLPNGTGVLLVRRR